MIKIFVARRECNKEDIKCSSYNPKLSLLFAYVCHFHEKPSEKDRKESYDFKRGTEATQFYLVGEFCGILRYFR